MKTLKKTLENVMRTLTLATLIFLVTFLTFGQKSNSVKNNELMIKQLMKETEKLNKNVNESDLIINKVKTRPEKKYTVISELVNMDKNLLAEVKEEKIKVENWMLDKSHFLITSDLNNENTVEEKLKIESWMLDENHFNTIHETEPVEEKVAIESWMLDSSHWATQTN